MLVRRDGEVVLLLYTYPECQRGGPFLRPPFSAEYMRNRSVNPLQICDPANDPPIKATGVFKDIAEWPLLAVVLI